MIISEANLKDQLEELYGWYFKHARIRAQDEYQVGKCDGAVEALGAIYLGLYGGKEMMKLWERNLGEAKDGKE